ncbi:Hypp8643 [Branchiostoma lanceolatum]|uniref:Hypp8643 protein n=1 Tax=Branchiostoma lanceolatum TaxID=7740 RepID=A0A8J9Z9N4_BRALA|nr:Hypp8643 [Branchiostoma lanceolatum]
MTSCAYFATLVTWSFGWMASGNNVLTVYVEGGEEGQEDTEEKDKKDDTKAEEKNEGDSVSLEVVSEDEEEVEKEEEEEGKRTAKQNGTIVAMVVLKVFGLAFFINYLVNVAGKEAHDSCSVPGEKRQACGSWSTSERECVDMGCCYRSPFSVPNAPWCYHKASEEDTNNWFVGSLAGEDSSEETDPDKDTTSDLGAVFDWLLNTDQPSGDEEHMKETEDPTWVNPPDNPHHSSHQRSPDEGLTEYPASDGHGLMPPNHPRDPNNPDCNKPPHHALEIPPHHALETPPHHAPEIPSHHAPGTPPHHAPEIPSHHAPEIPPHHAPEIPSHHAPNNPPHYGIPDPPPHPEPARGSTHDRNPPSRQDPTPHAKHDAKPPHPDSRPKAASGHHPPPAHTRPPHHKEPKQETPVDCHHNVMCRLSEWEAGHKVINGLPADPTVRHLLEAVAWLMMIGALCMIFCFCYLFRRVEPPKEEEGKESDAPGDEKGPPATFDVETEMDGKEKLPPVAFVEAGDYSDPWSDRDDVVINPAELKALMAKLQEEENTING